VPIHSALFLLINVPRSVKRTLVVLSDLVICLFSVWLAFWVGLDIWNPFSQVQLWITAISCLLAFPIFIYYGVYRSIFRFFGPDSIASIARVFIFYAALFFLFLSIISIDTVPRSIGILQPAFWFIGIVLYRFCIRYIFNWYIFSTASRERVKSNILIYGAGKAGRQLVAALSVDNDIVIKGFIDDDMTLHGSTINGLPVFGADNIKKEVAALKVTDLLLAIPAVTQDRRIEIIKSLSGCGARVRTMPSLHDIGFGVARVSDLQELDVNDLLGRFVVPPDIALLEKNIRNKNVLVTGAGGSIGGELCRQIIKFSPKSLVLIDSSEHSLYMIYEELKHLVKRLDIHDLNLSTLVEKDLTPEANRLSLVPYLASVRDAELMAKIIFAHRPDSVFHAAAYKHVPLVEQNFSEGIKNNVIGTLNCAKASVDAGVSHFTLVSTDKAVRPTNIMGASKRIAELVLQGLAGLYTNDGNKTCFSIVRFGNVLGSSGSVVPLFNSQIKAGSPISLTHPDVTRYFMTIPEAAQLVIQASAMATGGDVYVLDMGEPVRIYDLATRMIHLSGLLVKDENNPYGDIEIQITGLRPGEKLYEELLIGDNPQPTEHPKVMKAHEEFMHWDELEKELKGLNLALQEDDYDLIRKVLKRLVPGYLPGVKV